MHIVVGNTPFVKKDPEKEPSFFNYKKIVRMSDRRKTAHDRRKNNRDGVFVTLSIPCDRRLISNRRRA